MENEYCQLLSVSRNTYYVHKREKRPIINLLEKYFSKEDLEEFIASGQCTKFEKYHHIEFNILKNSRIKYMNSFKKYDRFTLFSSVFMDFYFNFLMFLKTKNIFTSDFCSLFDEYKISYFLQKKNKFESLFDLLKKDLNVFKDWDDGMLIFIDSLLENSLQNLFSEADSKEEQNIALYQFIGYYVYSKNSSLDRIKKLNITSVIFHMIKKEDINIYNLASMVAQTYDKYIDDVLNGNTPKEYMAQIASEIEEEFN